METQEGKPWVSVPQALHEGPAPPLGASWQRPPPGIWGPVGGGDLRRSLSWVRRDLQPRLERARSQDCYSLLVTPGFTFLIRWSRRNLKIITQSASGRDAPQVILPSEGQAGQGQSLWRLGPGLDGHMDPWPGQGPYLPVTCSGCGSAGAAKVIALQPSSPPGPDHPLSLEMIRNPLHCPLPSPSDDPGHNAGSYKGTLGAEHHQHQFSVCQAPTQQPPCL